MKIWVVQEGVKGWGRSGVTKLGNSWVEKGSGGKQSGWGRGIWHHAPIPTTQSILLTIACADGAIIQTGLDADQFVLDFLGNRGIKIVEGGQTGTTEVVAAGEGASLRPRSAVRPRRG